MAWYFFIFNGRDLVLFMKSCKGIIITCEHGGNRVPGRYAQLFAPYEKDLNSHRGYDPGALELARAISSALAAPLLYSTTTRLLVELNRSSHHRHFFSSITRDLAIKEKEWINQNYYQPYRKRVHQAILDLHALNKQVLHISVHSFTPAWEGVPRKADVGLLYDPKRAAEARLCRDWKAVFKTEWPAMRVRMNYPYRGSSDGFTTSLRRMLPPRDYCGIELEVNQKFFTQTAADKTAIKFMVINSLLKTLGRRKMDKE